MDEWMICISRNQPTILKNKNYVFVPPALILYQVFISAVNIYLLYIYFCIFLLQGFNLWCVISHTGRRQTVSDAELNEFKTQAECLKWAKPVVLGTDHGNWKWKCIQKIYFAKKKITLSVMLRFLLPLSLHRLCKLQGTHHWHRLRDFRDWTNDLRKTESQLPRAPDVHCGHYNFLSPLINWEHYQPILKCLRPHDIDSSSWVKCPLFPVVFIYIYFQEFWKKLH